MEKSSKIYVAGHSGLVGSALLRKLCSKGYSNIVTRSHRDLDLRKQEATEQFFERERPDTVFLAAAKVGGIMANTTHRAEFIYDNLAISTNVIHAAWKFGVKKLLNLGSSCIYPKHAPQPLKEESLLSGPLEPTNEPYAVAKIGAIKLCRYYNEQHGTNFISVMPANLYGPNDHFDLEASHVLPAFIRKFHLAKLLSQARFDQIGADLAAFGNAPPGRSFPVRTEGDGSHLARYLSQYGIRRADPSGPLVRAAGPSASGDVSINLWGSGEPYREFLHVDDLSEACLFLMENYESEAIGEFVNIGAGEDIQVKALAEKVAQIVGFRGSVSWDPSKPDGTPRKLLDGSRLKSLGWIAHIKLEDGIRKTYDWYCSRLGSIGAYCLPSSQNNS